MEHRLTDCMNRWGIDSCGWKILRSAVSSYPLFFQYSDFVLQKSAFLCAHQGRHINWEMIAQFIFVLVHRILLPQPKISVNWWFDKWKRNSLSSNQPRMRLVSVKPITEETPDWPTNTRNILWYCPAYAVYTCVLISQSIASQLLLIRYFWDTWHP